MSLLLVRTSNPAFVIGSTLQLALNLLQLDNIVPGEYDLAREDHEGHVNEGFRRDLCQLSEHFAPALRLEESLDGSVCANRMPEAEHPNCRQNHALWAARICRKTKCGHWPNPGNMR